jgi:hypothetical protein
MSSNALGWLIMQATARNSPQGGSGSSHFDYCRGGILSMVLPQPSSYQYCHQRQQQTPGFM